MLVADNILNSNFFQLFDIPPVYEVDLDKIKQLYVTLQSRLHPDNFAMGSDMEKRLSMQQTSHLNEAMQTLKDPVLRAAYLLKLNAIDINLENETTMDAAFLMQQLALRESLEEIKHSALPAQEGLDKLDRIYRDVNEKIKMVMADFSASFDAGKFDEAREWLRKLQFLQKAKKEVSALSADIEDGLMG